MIMKLRSDNQSTLMISKSRRLEVIRTLSNLTNELSIKLKYPSLDQFIENNFDTGQTNDDVFNHLRITACIEAVSNQEESWEASDCAQKELSEFVEQMNTKQFKQIEKFFTTMPVSHVIAVKIQRPVLNPKSFLRVNPSTVRYGPYES